MVNVKRQQSVFVRFLYKNENERESELDGLTARVIEHEINHLNGVLILDYAPLSDRLKLNVINELKL